MLYLFLDNRSIKLLSLKKSIMGQYEALFFDKQHQTDLLQSGKVVNIDFVASAVKEAISHLNRSHKEKDVYLILPQESFSFLRITIPTDIAPSALESFIKDKAQSAWQINLDQFFYSYLMEKDDQKTIINFFAIEKTKLAEYQEALTLIDLKIVSLLPDTLAYFKLFEKTLRKEKPEKIFFVNYEDGRLIGYFYDTNGLLTAEKWQATLTADETIESVLKKQVIELEKKEQKLSRLVLSGEKSEKIRQDTFTKAIKLWTNPLKRIISGFYEEYLKQLIPPEKQTFSILKYDVCFGAFIFSVENKQFSFFKKSAFSRLLPSKKIGLPGFKLPWKELFIFIISFSLSFVTFVFISRSNINLNFFKNLSNVTPLKPKIITPTPLPTTTPTPTPSFKKEDLKIKVLNGSGVVGKAGEVKTILSEKGYEEILTDNADSFDYETTTIRVKKNRRPAVEWIKNDLKNYLTEIKTETLNEKEVSDIILIIGKDFE